MFQCNVVRLSHWMVSQNLPMEWTPPTSNQMEHNEIRSNPICITLEIDSWIRMNASINYTFVCECVRCRSSPNFAIENSILLTLFQTYRLLSIYIQVESFNKYQSQKVIFKRWAFQSNRMRKQHETHLKDKIIARFLKEHEPKSFCFLCFLAKSSQLKHFFWFIGTSHYFIWNRVEVI